MGVNPFGIKNSQEKSRVCEDKIPYWLLQKTHFLGYGEEKWNSTSDNIFHLKRTRFISRAFAYIYQKVKILFFVWESDNGLRL